MSDKQRCSQCQAVTPAYGRRRGLCRKCYERARYHGTLDQFAREYHVNDHPCLSCAERRAWQHGLCNVCLQRAQARGVAHLYPACGPRPVEYAGPVRAKVGSAAEVRARNQARERARVKRHEGHPARKWYWRRHLYARCFRPGPLPGRARLTTPIPAFPAVPGRGAVEALDAARWGTGKEALI